MSDEAAFLDALKVNPADDTARLVYADWLDEQGEAAKAEYLRLTCRLAAGDGDIAEDPPDAARLLELGRDLPDDWAEAAAGRFDLLLTGYESPADKIRVIKVLRERFGIGLAEAKQLSEALPARLLGWVPFDAAVLFARPMTGAAPMDLRLRPSVTPGIPYPGRQAVVASFWTNNWDADEEDPAVVAAAVQALARLTAEAIGVSADRALELARARRVYLARGLSVLSAPRFLDRIGAGLRRHDGFVITCSVTPDPDP
jgi:uncharacterized protein (TIGR02996 family)